MRWEEDCSVTLDDRFVLRIVISACRDLTSRCLHQLLGSIRLDMASGTKPHNLEFEQHEVWGVASGHRHSADDRVSELYKAVLHALRQCLSRTRHHKCKDAAEAEPLFSFGRYTSGSVQDTECLKPEFRDLTRVLASDPDPSPQRSQASQDPTAKQDCNATATSLNVRTPPQRDLCFFGASSEALGRKATTSAPRLRPRSRKSPSPEVSHRSHDHTPGRAPTGPRIKEPCASFAPAAHRRWPGASSSPPHLGRGLWQGPRCFGKASEAQAERIVVELNNKLRELRQLWKALHHCGGAGIASANNRQSPPLPVESLVEGVGVDIGRNPSLQTSAWGWASLRRGI